MIIRDTAFGFSGRVRSPSLHYMRIPRGMSFRTVDFRVKGKVQGVFFRVFAKNTAQELGVVGWVKNDPVGSSFV